MPMISATAQPEARTTNTPPTLSTPNSAALSDALEVSLSQVSARGRKIMIYNRCRGTGVQYICYLVVVLILNTSDIIDCCRK